jgi:hypothetical protein
MGLLRVIVVVTSAGLRPMSGEVLLEDQSRGAPARAIGLLDR